jgi:hypothetical protein
MASEHKRGRYHAGVLGPVILIIVGVVFLLEQNGIIAPHALSRWWPLLLIVIGAWLLFVRYNRKDG